ncbi:MAG: ABC transporter ATP-binding protein [Planctomycetota bacterium]
MKCFWRYAGRMFHYRARLFLALLMAFLSAFVLGTGIIALVPILNNIFDEEGTTLPALITRYAEKYSVEVPQGFLDVLPQGQFGAVVALASVIGVLSILGATANFLHQYFSLTLSLRTVADIRRSAFHRLLHQPLGSIIGSHGSDQISRVISDTNMLGRGFEGLTNKAVAQVTRGFVLLVVACVLNLWLTLVTILVAPIVSIIIRKLGKRIRRASRAAMRKQGKLLGVANEVLHGFRVIKVHAAESAEIGRFTRINEEVVSEQLRARTARALAGPVMELLAIIVLGSLAVIAAKPLIDRVIDPGVFFVALGALAGAGQSLRPLNMVIQDLHVADAAAGRIDELIKQPLEDEGDRRKPALPRHARSVTFEDVTFRYAGADVDALASVSLEVTAGESIAIVGTNGSGKTTLLSLVPRLYDPDQGRVCIDGTDLRTGSLRSLRRQIGVVTQETVIFRGTVASNIAYALPPHRTSHEAIVDAAKRAHAHDFISKLPDGYDTKVGDQGLTLSGGQRQRIAIARAVIRDPAILLMDEATSMIDAESERLISDAISDFGAGRTCMIVAHRLSTVVKCDRIVVMDAGRIVDIGPHDALVERCALYRQIAQHQLQPATA